MWLSDVFTSSELEYKTRCLYQEYCTNINNLVNKFEEYFDISFKMAFGDEDPKDCLLEMLHEYYPNEYLIKTLFSNKYLNNTNPIYELPLGDSRADVVDVSKTLSCYEIKTKYDNLDRLEKQLNDYSKYFSYIYVVCSEDKYDDVLKIAPEHCGIITYKNRKNFSFIKQRQATMSTSLDIELVLSVFYKKELKLYFNSVDRKDIVSKFSKKSILLAYRDALFARSVDK